MVTDTDKNKVVEISNGLDLNKGLEGFKPNTDDFPDNEGGISAEDIKQEVRMNLKAFEPPSHDDLLDKLLLKVEKVDFDKMVYPQKAGKLKMINALYKEAMGMKDNESKKDVKRVKNKDNEEESKDLASVKLERVKAMKAAVSKMKLKLKHYKICTIEEIMKLAQKHKWGLAKQNDFIYVYNGAYWKKIEVDSLKMFLGKAAEKMGVDKFDARDAFFRDLLYKQFLSTAYLKEPDRPVGSILINLKNGTYEITPSSHNLREFRQEDFLKYQLPFEFNAKATAPMFHKYLKEVQPKLEQRQILSEYLGYIFLPELKLEKALILYGTGANGKSVFFEVVERLLGDENVSNYSLQDLTDHKGYHRAELSNKLVNYASEINGKLEADTFKQLVSGEPLAARLPYGNPFILKNYARLIFNCNELPREVEYTNAFFRRFLILPFDVTIPEEEQDKELGNKITGKYDPNKSELSGVFNWVLEGLERLRAQKKFTYSEEVKDQLNLYQLESDSVRMFLDEKCYEPSSNNDFKTLKDIYTEYQGFCIDNGFKNVSSRKLKKRMKDIGYHSDRKNVGNVVFLKKKAENDVTVKND